MTAVRDLSIHKQTSLHCIVICNTGEESAVSISHLTWLSTSGDKLMKCDVFRVQNEHLPPANAGLI